MPERFGAGHLGGGGGSAQVSYVGGSRSLLRVGGRTQRKEHSAGAKHEAFPDSFHLITLSALASTFGGIVKPICFAAFRLITSSNFVGCSMGRSPGFAPLSILST